MTNHKKAHERGVIYMTPTAWKALKIEAVQRGIPMGELVMELIAKAQAEPDGQVSVEIIRHKKDRT